MNTDEEMLNRITERIIGCAYRVHNTLGYGFLEKVYEMRWHTSYAKKG
jgi:GxxExxY protein